MRPQAKEYKRPLEAGKGEEMDSFLEPTEGTQPCQELDLDPVKLISKF